MKTNAQLLIILSIAGGGVSCGGSNSQSSLSTSLGKGVVTIDWPAPSRLIPTASNAIKLELIQTGQPTRTIVVPRPIGGGTSSTSITNVDIAPLTIKAQGVPNSNGTGTPQAEGVTVVNVESGSQFTASLTMDSTIASLRALGGKEILVEEFQTRSIDVEALDDLGKSVLIDKSTLHFTSANPAIAKFTAADCEGVSAGVTQVTVRDSESGKSDVLSCRISPYHDGYYTTSVGSSRRISFKGKVTIGYPNFAVTKWFAYAPVTQNTADQDVLAARTYAETRTGALDFERQLEPSGLRRPFLSKQIAATDLTNPRELVLVHELLLNLRTRSVSPGRPSLIPSDLTQAEKSHYTSETEMCNFRNGIVKQWMDSQNLWKDSTEDSVVFAKRVASAMKDDFVYEILNTPNSTASQVVSNKKGECLGLGHVVTAVLRANGIPARMQTGGYSNHSGTFDPLASGTASHHLTPEFFHRTAGWIRVDGPGLTAVGSSYVGADDHSFMAHSIGDQFDVGPALGLNIPKLWMIQSPSAFLNSSGGSASGSYYRLEWTIEP